MEPHEYGRNYYCIKVPVSVSQSGEIYVHADCVTIEDNGAIAFCSGEDHLLLTLAAGSWYCVYLAGLLDGSAVAVVHWPEEIIE